MGHLNPALNCNHRLALAASTMGHPRQGIIFRVQFSGCPRCSHTAPLPVLIAIPNSAIPNRVSPTMLFNDSKGPPMPLHETSPTVSINAPPKPTKVFDPTKVGQPRYPSNAETWEARRLLLAENVARARAAGRMSRKGSPNGFRGRRGEAERLQAEATAMAFRMVDRWNRANLTAAQLAVYIPSDRSDCDVGDEALAAVLAVAICPAYAATERLMAARIALTYLRPRPSGRAVVTLESALTFLDDLASEDGQGGDSGMSAPSARF
jgi:hypothetical protein